MSAVPSLLADEASFTERLNARLADIKAESRANVDLSLAERLALCERAEPGFLDTVLESLEPIEWQRLYYDWRFWARKKQLAPTGAWRTLFWLAGRATGKNRAAAEWFLERILSGHTRQGVLVGPTLAEIKRNQLGGLKRRSKGENGSGLLDILPAWMVEGQDYKVTQNTGEVYFPKLDCRIYSISAETPDFVGMAPSIVWIDEIVKFPHPEFLLSQIAFSNRERSALPPQVVITSTPRPKKFLKELILKAGVQVIHARTDENRGNVSDEWLADMANMPERERLQELEAEILGDNPDALFTPSDFDRYRVDNAPALDRIVIGVDPSGSDRKNADPTGLVAVGRTGAPTSRSAHLYVLEARSLKANPEEWGKQAFEMAERHGASGFAIEKNYGAGYIASTLRAAAERRGYTIVPRIADKTAFDFVHPETKMRFEVIEVLARGDKAQRAYPVAALASSAEDGTGGRIHVVGHLTPFEDELTQWNPKTSTNSPGQLDAFVHACVELLQLDRRERKTDHRAAMAGLVEANERLAAARPASGGREVGLPSGLSRSRGRLAY